VLLLASAAAAAAPTITEYGAGINGGSGPAGIAAGPDGNLWFTERGGDRMEETESMPATRLFQARLKRVVGKELAGSSCQGDCGIRPALLDFVAQPRHRLHQREYVEVPSLVRRLARLWPRLLEGRL
jgi:hypothetical protein